MANGRTAPLLVSCEPDGGKPTDYVVKLNGGMEMATAGAVFELAASRLATLLQISCPEPALVSISKEFADLAAELEPDHAELLQKSVGWNYGTELMRNLAIWPIDRRIPESQLDTTADIFAFDALIQNPDRTFKNPNLGTQGDAIRIFDHECAFSFILNIFRPGAPWILAAETYLADHVFVASLRNKTIDWGPFFQLLSGLQPQFFSDLLKELPEEWDASHIPEIERHIMSIRDHAHEFEMELRRRIA